MCAGGAVNPGIPTNLTVGAIRACKALLLYDNKNTS